jgi:predicted aspartyl protease
MGGRAFQLPCKIVQNGLIIKAQTLLDTGANGFIFISQQLATQLCERFQLPLHQTNDACAIQGYDGKTSQQINYILFLAFEIDGHRFPETPMVVVDMNRHDLIFGRKWFSQFDVLLDCRRHSLVWPDSRKDYVARHELKLPREAL